VSSAYFAEMLGGDRAGREKLQMRALSQDGAKRQARSLRLMKAILM